VTVGREVGLDGLAEGPTTTEPNAARMPVWEQVTANGDPAPAF